MKKFLLYIHFFVFAFAIVLFTNCSSSDSKKQSSEFNADNGSCPEGFVFVPRLESEGMGAFCVGKYETKKLADGAYVSVAEGKPVNFISREEAKAACESMGSGFYLMSILDSIAVNKSIELGTEGQISRGHTDRKPNHPLAASENDEDGCFGTRQDCREDYNEQKRTHMLSSGDVIWDKSGNVAEWVSGSISVGDRLQRTIPVADLDRDYGSESVVVTAPNGSKTASIASLLGSSRSDDSLGTLFLRDNDNLVIVGGTFSSRNKGGIFTVRTGLPRDREGTKAVDIGFRCTPEPTSSSDIFSE